MGDQMDQAKGRVKQAAGDLADDDDLKNEGKLDEMTGKVKGTVNDVVDKVKDKIEDLRR